MGPDVRYATPGDGSNVVERGPHPVLVAILFLVPRVALLFARRPFFDELFTRWISAKRFEGILAALHHDSGPPLYYFLVHLIGNPPVAVLRAVSLLFAAAALAALLIAKRNTAALLLAVFPPAVLFSVDARAYALCAMFVTFGVLALDAKRPTAAALAFVAAAYSHYYGVLFFPLAWRRWWLFLLFAPGAWLAFEQPRMAIAWIGTIHYPEVLFARPPLWLAIAGGALLVAAAVRVNRFAVMTLVPLGLALALGVYFPLRFESVIAAPLVLWLALSARRWMVPLLVAVGAAFCIQGIAEHWQRPVDDYRAAAQQLARIASPGERIVASGYLYLEAASVLDGRVQAFPAEQAEHPGWRALARPGSVPPPGPFLWIGERAAPELVIIRRTRTAMPVYVNARAAIVKVN